MLLNLGGISSLMSNLRVADFALDPLRCTVYTLLLVDAYIILQRTGPSILYLYVGGCNPRLAELIYIFLRLEKTGENKYKVAGDIFRGQLNSHPRTAQGQFWHKLKYPNQGQVYSDQGFTLSR